MDRTTKRELEQLERICDDENLNLDGSFDPGSSVTLDRGLIIEPKSPPARRKSSR